MKTEAFASSKMIELIFRAIGAVMESRFRYQFFSPIKILQGVEIYPRQTVLEVGCGTGFYTMPAAQLIGEQGCLVAIDVLPASIETVSKKAMTAQLDNVYLVQSDAKNCELEAQCMDAVLLFGVIPAPMLPLKRLLPKMERILKLEGVLAVWPAFPGWLPKATLQTRLFSYACERKGVFNFRRI